MLPALLVLDDENVGAARRPYIANRPDRLSVLSFYPTTHELVLVVLAVLLVLDEVVVVVEVYGSPLYDPITFATVVL